MIIVVLENYYYTLVIGNFGKCLIQVFRGIFNLGLKEAPTDILFKLDSVIVSAWIKKSIINIFVMCFFYLKKFIMVTAPETHSFCSFTFPVR